MRTEDIRAKVRESSEERFSFMRRWVRQIPSPPISLKRRWKVRLSSPTARKKAEEDSADPGFHPEVSTYIWSVILRPDIEPRDTTLVTLMAAVACALALRRVTGISITIKWPNDLMVSGRKIGGILTEMKTTGARIISVVVGIGINVNGDSGFISGGDKGNSYVSEK